MYDLKNYDPKTRQLVCVVRHSGRVAGGSVTTVEVDVTFELEPDYADKTIRVRPISVDTKWIRSETVPLCAEELARILERVVAGLRQGPGPILQLLAPATPIIQSENTPDPATEEPASEATP